LGCDLNIAVFLTLSELRTDSIDLNPSSIEVNYDIKGEHNFGWFFDKHSRSGLEDLTSAPPSIHGNGNQYTWEEGHSIFDIDPAPFYLTRSTLPIGAMNWYRILLLEPNTLLLPFPQMYQGRNHWY
jgi:hypothetical protein